MSAGVERGRERPLGRRLRAAALVLGLGCVLAFAWWSWDVESDDAICGSAFTVHPGSGYVVTGGEFHEAERRALSDQCEQAGAWPWRLGWVALGGCGLVALAMVAGPVVSRARRGGAGLPTG
jgi:hypothetical protein